MTKFIIIDPHVDDFIFNPLSFIFARRKPLKKYRYLSSYFKSSYYVSGATSSLPHSFNKKLPRIILNILSWIEVYLWRMVNNVNSLPLKKNQLLNSNLFIFAYKKIDELLNHLEIIGFNGRLIIHISHYHLFNINEKWFNRFDITLAFDADVSNVDYFKEKFPLYRKKIIIIPFQISQDYQNVNFNSNRNLRVFVTGTYHKVKNKFFGKQIDGFSTLHPHRLQFASLENLPSYVVNKLSLFDSSSNINPFALNQKKYFSFNMKDELLESSHAFIGSEVTGCMGIGTIEAMACGCIIFITRLEYENFSKTGLNPDCIIFDDINDLYNAIKDLKSFQYQSSVNNKKIASNYYGEKLFLNFLDCTNEF